MISTPLWRRLGTDPGIVGKPLTLDGRSYTVTGVMPEGSICRSRESRRRAPDRRLDAARSAREAEGRLYRLRAAASRESRLRGRGRCETRGRGNRRGRSRNHPSYTARLFDLRETVIKDIRPTLLLLFGGGGLLFLITARTPPDCCWRARSRARAKRPIRVALGASRAQLAAHYFAEGLLVSLAGAAGGVVLSVTLTPAIVSLAADYLPRAEEIAVDWTVLLFALAAAFLASALSSLAPLWQARRTAPADVLGDGVRASAGARSRRVSQSLVVGEIALAFALLAVSAVLIIHLRNLSRTSPGFDADHVLTFVLSVPGTDRRRSRKRIPLQRRLVEALQAIPGVDEVALANQLPLDGCCIGTNIYPEGRPADLGASQRTSLMAISPGYFRAMRIPLRRGRASDRSRCGARSTCCRRHQSGRRERIGATGIRRRVWEVSKSGGHPLPGGRRRRRREERRTEQSDCAGNLHSERHSPRWNR